MLHFISFLPLLLGLITPAETPKIAPPGTVAFQENKFIDTEPVKNLHWKEFLYFIKKDSAAAYYNAMLPDTTLKMNGRTYFSNPEFRNSPVTGISFDQALEYCKWRSKTVNKNLSESKPAKSGYKITYRLPKPEELKMVANKPKKVRATAEFQELTNNKQVIISKPFQQGAVGVPADGEATLTQTFRCVAYYEKW